MGAIGPTIKGIGAIMGLLPSSFVVIVACISPVKHVTGLARSAAVYSIVLAVITVGFVILFMHLERVGGSMPTASSLIAHVVLAICWIIMASW
jgi:hypothetical protein